MKKTIKLALTLTLASALIVGCAGGKDLDFKLDNEISVISREDGSGTRGAFIELFNIEEKDTNGNKIDHTTKEATIAPKFPRPVAEVGTIAKKDLMIGENLDGIGEYTILGKIFTYEEAKEKNIIPIGLINNKARLKKDVKKGQIITYDMVDLDKNTEIYKLRNRQGMREQ